MAFLNKEERDKLLDEIRNKKFNQIKGRLMRLDPKARLAYYRNVQESGKWMTRIVLEGLGTQVTLVETMALVHNKASYQLQQIIVEPTAENRL